MIQNLGTKQINFGAVKVINDINAQTETQKVTETIAKRKMDKRDITKLTGIDRHTLNSIYKGEIKSISFTQIGNASYNRIILNSITKTPAFTPIKNYL